MLFQVKQFDHLSLIEKKSFEIPLKQWNNARMTYI